MLPPPAVNRYPLVALLAGFVIVASLYNACVPVFEAPDEHTHFFVASHVARTGRLPVQSLDPAARGPWEQEGSQPPLYYLAAAPVIALTGAELAAEDLRYNHQNTMGRPALTGNENRFVHPAAIEGWPWHGYALAVHLVRGLSTWMAALTVLCVWSVAQRVFRDRPWLALAAAALVAFNPQFVHLAAAVSNDNAVVLLSAAALALLMRLADGHRDRPTILALTVVAGLAPLAKLSGLVVSAFTLLTLAAMARHASDRRFAVATAGAVLLSMTALSGWWYARNVVLYGSLTGLDFMLDEGMRRGFRPGPWLRGLPAELYGLWLSTWGIFGWFTVMLPAPLYHAISLASLVAVVGAGRAWVQRVPWVRWSRLAWLVLWSVLVLAGLLRWLAIAKGAHGRLLFPALPVLAVVLVLGWRQALPARLTDRALAAGVSALMLALAAFALVGVIRPAFAPPAAIAASAVPETANRIDALFGEHLRLVAVEAPRRVTEDSWVPVTLYWQVTGPIERDAFVALRLDQPVAGADAHPGIGLTTVAGPTHLGYPGRGNMPPDLLIPGPKVVVDEQVVRAPALATRPTRIGPTGTALRPPVAARLSVHVYDVADEAGWPVTDRDGRPIGSDVGVTVVLDPVATATGLRQAGRELSATDPLATFGDTIELRRLAPPPAGSVPYETGPPASTPEEITVTTPLARSMAPAGPLHTPVAWLARRAPAVDLTVFAHVVDADGRLVAQFDAPPATRGHYPSSRWRDGEIVVADVAWDVPNDAPPGARYTLLVGLYPPPPATRLAALDARGGRWPDDAVPLAHITVRPVPVTP